MWNRLCLALLGLLTLGSGSASANIEPPTHTLELRVIAICLSEVQPCGYADAAALKDDVKHAVAILNYVWSTTPFSFHATIQIVKDSDWGIWDRKHPDSGDAADLRAIGDAYVPRGEDGHPEALYWLMPENMGAPYSGTFGYVLEPPPKKGKNAYYIGQLLGHEVGHALGLAHTFDESGTTLHWKPRHRDHADLPFALAPPKYGHSKDGDFVPNDFVIDNDRDTDQLRTDRGFCDVVDYSTDENGILVEDRHDDSNFIWGRSLMGAAFRQGMGRTPLCRWHHNGSVQKFGWDFENGRVALPVGGDITHVAPGDMPHMWNAMYYAVGETGAPFRIDGVLYPAFSPDQMAVTFDKAVNTYGWPDICPAGDDDRDGICNPVDPCPQVPEYDLLGHNSHDMDADGDGIPQACDPCDLQAGALPADLDGDGLAGVCDSDEDGDGCKRNGGVFEGVAIPEDTDDHVAHVDGQLRTCSGQLYRDTIWLGDDHDGDGLLSCDKREDDADGDGQLNTNDPCPYDAQDLCNLVMPGGWLCAAEQIACWGPQCLLVHITIEDRINPAPLENVAAVFNGVIYLQSTAMQSGAEAAWQLAQRLRNASTLTIRVGSQPAVTVHYDANGTEVVEGRGKLVALRLPSNKYGAPKIEVRQRFGHVLDVDNDGVDDAFDNCLTTANAHQLDSDRDGWGDACDADRDQDGTIEPDEVAAVKACVGHVVRGLGHEDPEPMQQAAFDCDWADLDGDGIVTMTSDYLLLALPRENTAPGPRINRSRSSQ